MVAKDLHHESMNFAKTSAFQQGLNLEETGSGNL